jgi:hypothetical protein
MMQKNNVLADSIFNSFHELGIALIEMDYLLGIDYREVLNGNIYPNTEAAEKGFVIIGIYQMLFNLLDGNTEIMKRWMHSYCEELGYKPYDLLAKPNGMNRLHYFLSNCEKDTFFKFPDEGIPASA